MKTLSKKDIQGLVVLLQEASEAILDVYTSENFKVENKTDDSPLTRADSASHAVLDTYLKKNFSTIPVLSEEGKAIAYELRKERSEFWCVDPLDGTKEFIKRNGEFCICLALVRDAVPVFGMVALPTESSVYRGGKEYGVWCQSFDGEAIEIKPEKSLGDSIRVVGSRSHQSQEDREFINSLPGGGENIEIVSVGSAIKFCKLCTGEADYYPRFKPTMEWDTAAGHAMVTALGGAVVDQNTGNPMMYNKESLRNNSFVAFAPHCNPIKNP